MQLKIKKMQNFSQKCDFLLTSPFKCVILSLSQMCDIKQKEMMKLLNRQLLLFKIAEKNMTVKSVATEIGIDTSSFFRKMSKNTFKCSEAQSIAKVLELTTDDVLKIFFA